MEYDAIVLGAGIVGISTAINLKKQGLKVMLVDKQAIGLGASGGNAGMIVRSVVHPYAFPFSPSLLLRSLFKRFGGFNYHTEFLLKHMGWLASYAWYSRSSSLRNITKAMLPLIESCVDEHLALANEASSSHLIRHSGWLCVYRHNSTFRNAIEKAQAMTEYGLSYRVLDRQQLSSEYPINTKYLAGAILWADQYFCTNPKALVQSYGDLFLKIGGKIACGDASQTEYINDHWVWSYGGKKYSSKNLVLALGAHSNDIYKRLGYEFPMLGKRGYHMHYKTDLPTDYVVPITDIENGYVMAPMTGGLRITTGIELADRDAKHSPNQLTRIEKKANDIVQLKARIDEQAWLGVRPCLPDMLPVMGAGYKHKGLWFCFGHNHVGFSTAPGSGRLMANMIMGKDNNIDVYPFRPHRFK